jgi:hypothetical protein
MHNRIVNNVNTNNSHESGHHHHDNNAFKYGHQ